MQKVGIDAASETSIMRSFLFVPGDSERKLAKAASAAADALVLDLEDAVSADRSISRAGLFANTWSSIATEDKPSFGSV